MSGGWADSHHNQRRAGSGWDETRATKRVLDRDDHRCQIRGPGCLGYATEVDHVVPLSATGPAGDHDANKQAACGPCHQAKTTAEAATGRAKKSRRRPPERHPGLL